MHLNLTDEEKMKMSNEAWKNRKNKVQLQPLNLDIMNKEVEIVMEFMKNSFNIAPTVRTVDYESALAHLKDLKVRINNLEV